MTISLTRLAVATSIGALLTPATPAAAQSSTYVDFTGEAGYSSNPFLRVDGDSSAFGRLSAYAAHTRTSERSSTGLSAYVENTTYLDGRDSKQIFSVNARTSYQASEQVRIFGSAGVSGDLAGQLSSRFVTVPPTLEVPDEPTLPPDPIVDPDLDSLTERQYRVNGQVGASIRASERGTVSVSAGAQRILYTDDSLDDRTIFSADAAYDHTLSERSTVGGRLGFWHANYNGDGGSTTVINPQLTYGTQLSESIRASGAIGLSFSKQKEDGSDDSSVDLSLNGSVCRITEFERLCGRASRYANSSGAGNLIMTTSVGADWSRRLDDVQTVQLSADLVRYNGDEDQDVDSDAHHYGIAGSYDRKIGRRASVGLNAGARSLSRDGPDPDTDFSASLYLRYRVGDLR